MSAYVQIPTLFTENDAYLEEAGDELEEGARPSSAPALFSAARESSIGAGNYAISRERTLIESGVEDIRNKPDYPEFYKKNHHLFNLPPPFDPALYKLSPGKQALDERHYVDDMFTSGGEVVEGDVARSSGRYSPTLDMSIPMDRNSLMTPPGLRHTPLSPSAASPTYTNGFKQPVPVYGALPSSTSTTPAQNGRSPLKSPLNTNTSTMMSFAANPNPQATRPTPQARPVPFETVIPQSRTAVVGHAPSDNGADSDEDDQPRRGSHQQGDGKTGTMPVGPIWKPYRRDDVSPLLRPRNKSLGKIAINADQNLSSSTENLLALAGGAAHYKESVNLSDSPPTPSAMAMKDGSRVRVTTFPRPNTSSEMIPPGYSEQSDSHQQQGAIAHQHLNQLPVQMGQLGPGQVAVPVPVPLPVPVQMGGPRGHTMMPMNMNGQFNLPMTISPQDYAHFLQTFATMAMNPGMNPGMNPSMASHPQQQSAQGRNICRFYSQGFCSRGSQCTFLHVDAPQSAQGGYPTGHQQSLPEPHMQLPQRTMPHSNMASHIAQQQPPAPVPAPIAQISTPAPPPQSLKQARVPPSNPARYQNLTLDECVGQIAMMCLDQHGCRFLQKELDDNETAKRDQIFGEVIPHIADLMSDPFGNYLCQKLIEKCNPQQRLEIVRGCSPELVSISKNMHGTRAVQRLIETLEIPEEFRLVRESLKGNVVALIQDLNGNHVIQKCLNKMEPNDNQFIYDAVAQNCVQVATHRHGCCVFQRCVDHATLDQKRQLVEQIKNNGVELVQDAYGNYVVQYVLDLDMPNLATELIERLQTKLYYLARQKFSSNVVEKCLKVGNGQAVTRIMRELLFENPDPNGIPSPLPGKEQAQTKLFSLLQDSYGNYVVQTCLSEGAHKAPREYAEMSNLLRPVVHQLSRNVPYMKRIQSLLSLPSSPVNSDDEGSDIDSGRHEASSTGAHSSSSQKNAGKSRSKPSSRRESNADRRRHTLESSSLTARGAFDDGAATSPIGFPSGEPQAKRAQISNAPSGQNNGSSTGHVRSHSGSGNQRR